MSDNDPPLHKRFPIAYSITREEADNEQKEHIVEFLNDFQWYYAFDLHYSWIEFHSQKCLCKTNPIAFKNWIVKKWEARSK